MKFENIIKKISGFLAAGVIFILAATTYLKLKGFETGPDGKIVLVQGANAAMKTAMPTTQVDMREALPQNHVLGNPNAPVAIYEFSSLGCFHCQDFHVDLLPRLKEEFIDTGKVKLIFADFPLDKPSLKASMLARCMPEDKYYDFLAMLFKKQGEWHRARNPEDVLLQFAALDGLDVETARQCLSDEKVENELMAIRQQGIDSFGIQGTPALLVATREDREVLNGLPGYAGLKEILDKALGN